MKEVSCMGYDYDFEYVLPDAVEGTAEGVFMGAAGFATGILLLIWFLAMGFSVASYVLRAVGTYRIAKRRGIHHAWLAWIPVGFEWLLGSISDHYQYVAKRKVTKRRKILLILSVILNALSCLLSVFILVLALSAGGSAAAGAAVDSILMIALMVIGYWGLAGLSIAILVFSYIAYYDLFQSCKPNNAVLFLVLSVLFNVTQPFFVFACSSSDQGMPARRPRQPAAQIPDEQPEPAEPEEEELPVVEAEVVEDPDM